MSDDRLKSLYHAVFTSPQGKELLADLIPYCHGRRTTFDADPRVHAFKEGQRDVLMRIVELTNLSIEEIYQLRGMGRVRTPGDDQ